MVLLLLQGMVKSEVTPSLSVTAVPAKLVKLDNTNYTVVLLPTEFREGNHMDELESMVSEPLAEIVVLLSEVTLAVGN